ncbi:DUF805 domain-containing protein [Lacticaseibacillus songhuajiangensis]|jgi:uncharacterized membrane protein YhaH (DUF805 family)|uniref:DUF805 domain-containing protein n=1 Tax=Lacticaseibacillus songhuajiangensis TaxID=1296539 RepID=UPI000F7B9B2F|nr:DUF805 domain-containing protein [Lacticaseibacillus songhuajiangensis]
MGTQKVSFIEALRLFFKNYANFRGRSSRSEYWYMFLWNAIYSAIMEVWVFMAILHMPLMGNNYTLPSILRALMAPLIVVAVVSVATLVPWVSLSVRRFRDADYSPWYLLLTMALPAVLLSLSNNVFTTFGNVCTVVGLALVIAHMVMMARRSMPAFHN